MEKSKNHIVNLGCRLNIYEGEVIKSLVKKNNVKNSIIINSCAVTNEAVKKVNYEINKAKKKFPNKKIIVTGCSAQINPEKYHKMDQVDYVIGNNEKLDSKTWSSLNKINSLHVGNILLKNQTHHHLIEKFEGKSRAYIEIQQGCDHRCTFCVIPYGRGNNRSIPPGIIIDRINLLIKNGYKEVVLTGVDITDYGKDLPININLFQLVKKIFNLIPNLKQLRLSSIDCGEISNDFWPLLDEPRLMPHFHLSLQSGNDLILKRMKRRHSKNQVINFCEEVKKRRKDVVFGADIIAGFPTETQSMFKDSINLINDCNLTHLHIFPFSKRDLTPASKMPQIPSNIIKQRAKILREVGTKNLSKYLKKQVGNNAVMLVEKSNNISSVGKTQHFTKITVNKKLKEGTIVNCKIIGVTENILQAVLT
tara:strand:+ start:2763 stop:4025 length:1263 start_codon:yes stop_codon:yes gene_type:complete